MPEAFQDGALDRVSIPVEAIGSGKKPAKRKKRAKSRVPTNAPSRRHRLYALNRPCGSK